MKNAGWMYSHYLSSTQEEQRNAIEFGGHGAVLYGDRRLRLDVADDPSPTPNGYTPTSNGYAPQPEVVSTQFTTFRSRGESVNSESPLLSARRAAEAEDVPTFARLQRGGPGRSNVSSGRRRNSANHNPVGRTKSMGGQPRQGEIPLAPLAHRATEAVGPAAFVEDSWV